MESNCIQRYLVSAVLVGLGTTILPSKPVALAQEQTVSAASKKPWSRSDERPPTPPALGRFGDGELAMIASQRGGESMGGGLYGKGRRHRSVRPVIPGNPDGSDMSEIAAFAVDELSPTFDNPGAAISAFTAALAANEIVAVAGLLGLDVKRMLDDGATLESFVTIRDGMAVRLAIDDQGSLQILLIGAEAWPFPYPVIRDDDGEWSFDTMTGLQEIVNRRIGENELEAIATARAYISAQEEYASRDRDGDEVREYAQNLVSGEDETDGLYWLPSSAAGESPGGEYLQAGQQQGGYFGYKFRILNAQGDEMPGGAHDYVINGNMIAGFALLAWPVDYVESGLHSFLVSHHGTVYEADLGAATEAIVPYIERINPGSEWTAIAQ